MLGECNLAVVGGLVCLDDPESYAEQGYPCQTGQGVETRRIALIGPSG